jgi:hypothetical protein
MIGSADRQTLIARRSRNCVRSQASTTHGFGTLFLYDVKLSFSPKGLWSCHCRMRGDVSNKSLERHDDPRVETRRSDWGKARYLADSSYSAKTWLTQTPRVDLFLFAIVDMQFDVEEPTAISLTRLTARFIDYRSSISALHLRSEPARTRLV